MEIIKVKASAKINLALDVTGLRNDGYHFIESVFQSVGIFDYITISKAESGITLTCDNAEIPCNNSNIAYKAAELFMKKAGISSGLKIHIEKNIPSQAGLGGGSADGAGVLFGLNKLFDTSFDIRELAEIGEKIGADVAFFLYGGTAFVEGTGEKISSIRLLPPIDLVIAKGDSGISTPQAYKLIDKLESPKHVSTQKLLTAIDKGKFLKNCKLCENIFEQVTDVKDVFEIKKKMSELGAEVSLMSGSGSSVFGIFKDSTSAKICAEKLREIYPFAAYCKTLPQSLTEEK